MLLFNQQLLQTSHLTLTFTGTFALVIMKEHCNNAAAVIMQLTDLSRTDSDGPVCKDNRVSQQDSTKSGKIPGGIFRSANLTANQHKQS